MIKEKCPHCGNMVVGKFSPSATRKVLTSIAKKGGMKAVGAYVGSVFPVLGNVTGFFAGAALDLMYGDDINKYIDKVADEFFENKVYVFECPQCGHSWAREEGGNTQSYSYNQVLDPQELEMQKRRDRIKQWNQGLCRRKNTVHSLENQIATAQTDYNTAQSNFTKSLIWLIVFGIIGIYLVYYCWVEPFEYKTQAHDFLFGDYDTTRWHWSWLGMFLLAIIDIIIVIIKYNSCRELAQQKLYAKNNLETLPSNLELAKRDLEAYMQTKPSEY